jgi:hypothetical protein
MKKSACLISLLITVFIAAACGTNKTETDKIKNRTDPMAERILKAIDGNNYAEFSLDFDNALKAEYTDARFHEMNAFMKKSQGDYVSKSFFSIIRDKNTLTVQYFAVYKIKTPTYVLSLTFNNPEGSGPVSGFNLIPFNVSR